MPNLSKTATTLMLLAAITPGCSTDPIATPNVDTETTEPKTPPELTEPPKPSGTSPPGTKTSPPDETPRKANRLAQETSPYLLLHAHNPVDWYPWGTEAFEKALQENKLIFLSVGYSSCHWCHVMERESFEDEEIAALMNDHFVCIKVDREERPDVDSIYMTAVTLITGRGGWPMSVFLTPDAKPFFGGTYFPARDGDRQAATGFLSILKKVHEVWETSPEKITSDAGRLTDFVKQELDRRIDEPPDPLGDDFLNAVQDQLAEQFDSEFGGFGFDARNPHRPKFPEPSSAFFLLDRLHTAALSDEQRDEAKRLLIGTLDGMAIGGIRDHVGGGFHRYSVDRFWHIPHFEKMLYDNGQLASVYSDAYKVTGREDYRRIVRQLLEFVRREMTDELGGFYSALDAESDGEEGKFYRWTKPELQAALSDDEFSLFADVYGINDEPNFESEFYAPQLKSSLAEVARARETSEAELEQRLVTIRAKLLAIREKRVRPLTDTKIITSWNGLMIRGFADAGRLLEEPAYVAAAQRAAYFIWEKVRTKEGRLLRTFGQGKAKLNAYLDDYAFYVDGLIAIHRATDDELWLQRADELTRLQNELFWDDEAGGYFFTSNDHESLLARAKDHRDGARPSGNAIAALNLIYLSTHLDRPAFLEKARRTTTAASGIMHRLPTYAPRMAIAVGRLD